MLITIQFPLADVRCLLSCPAGRLPLPTWPIPQTQTEFVRSFGSIKRRRRKEIDSWPGEHMFCEADHALKFVTNPAVTLQEYDLRALKHHLNIEETDPAPESIDELLGLKHNPPEYLNNWLAKNPCGFLHTARCRFRRLMSDGRVVGRLEIGFQFHPWRPAIWVKRKCVEAIAACTTLSVRVGRQSELDIPLIAAGPSIAAHYLRSSTMHSNQLSPKEWWLSAGEPLIVVEHYHDEVPPTAMHFELPDLGLEVAHWRYSEGQHFIPVWAITGWNRDSTRQFRMHVSRLHAERECLKHILRLIAREKIVIEPGTAATDTVQAYLRDAIRIMSRSKRFRIPQSQLMKAVEDCEELIHYGERLSILAKLTDVRRNIWRLVETYTQARTQVGRTILNIKNSNVGFVNAGELRDAGSVNVSISTDSDSPIQASIKSLLQAVEENHELSQNARNDLVELLNAIKTQSILPPGKRVPKEMLKEIVKATATATGVAGSIAQVWAVWGQTIKAFFGIQ